MTVFPDLRTNVDVGVVRRDLDRGLSCRRCSPQMGSIEYEGDGAVGEYAGRSSEWRARSIAGNRGGGKIFSNITFCVVVFIANGI